MLLLHDCSKELTHESTHTSPMCRVFTVGSAVATLPWTALYVYLGTFTTNLANLAQVCKPLLLLLLR